MMQFYFISVVLIVSVGLSYVAPLFSGKRFDFLDAIKDFFSSKPILITLMTLATVTAFFKFTGAVVSGSIIIGDLMPALALLFIATYSFGELFFADRIEQPDSFWYKLSVVRPYVGMWLIITGLLHFFFATLTVL